MAETAGAPWSQAFARASGHDDFLDLTDSRFHQNGLLPDSRPFREEFEAWLSGRRYEPDSRGHGPAREAVARFYQELGTAVSADDVYLTASTSEAYFLLFTNFAQAGDTVALPRPGYPLFEHLAERARLKTAYYDQPFDDAQRLPPARLVVVISPNNPTGFIATRGELEALGRYCARHEALLVCDEVFDAFVHEGDLPRPLVVLPDAKTFTLNGISKRFGSPDLKLGWIVVSGPASFRAQAGATLEFANDLLLSANTYSQALLPRLFRDLGPWQQAVRGVLAENLANLTRWLDDHPAVVAPRPQGGIHGLLRWPGLPKGWDDERWSLHLLERFHLALHPGHFYEVREPNTLVYSLLKRPEAFREGLARLSSAEVGLAARR